MSAGQGGPHVAIVGGGISGLATAYELQEQARSADRVISFTLLESSSSLGGKIVTERVATPAGAFVVEGGPDSFLTQKPWAADLCRRLGLAADLIGITETNRGVYVLSGGVLKRLPEGMSLMIPGSLQPFLASNLISWPGKLRMLLDVAIPRRSSDDDESVGAFVRRRLGREALEKLAEPLLAGIHAADPDRLSLVATFPRFRDLEQKHGSLIRGARQQRKAAANGSSGGDPAAPQTPFLTLRGGVEQLVRALEGALESGTILTGARVTAIDYATATGYRILTDSGSAIQADAVVLATPANVSAELVRPLVPDLARLLESVRYVSTATISLGFRREDVRHPLDGTGFVVPRAERRGIFGCTWSSTKFEQRAPAGHVLLRCFVGGSGREEQVELSDEELVSLAREELGTIMGVAGEPLFARVYRWRQGNPQYDVGHPRRVGEIHSLARMQPGLVLTSGAFGGVGLPDCIRQGQEAACKVLSYLARSGETSPLRRAGGAESVSLPSPSSGLRIPSR